MSALKDELVNLPNTKNDVIEKETNSSIPEISRKISPKMQMSLNSDGILTLSTVTSFGEKKSPLYKTLLSDFYPFITSRIQASHFVREGYIAINGTTAEMPHHLIQKGDIVQAIFDWKKTFVSRVDRFYDAVEPKRTDPIPIVNRQTFPKDSADAIDLVQDKLIVIWKPPGVSPLHVNKSVFYKEYLNQTFNSGDKVLYLFLEYFTGNPCDIKGTKLLYEVGNSIGGLCVAIVSQNNHLEDEISNAKVTRYFHAMCHGKLSEDAQTRLEEQGFYIDQTSIRCNDGSTCSSSDFLTEFRFYTTTSICGTQLRLIFKEAGNPLVGNAKYAIPLKNVSKRGVLLAVVGVSFYNPLAKEFQFYEHPEPQKFNCIFNREAAFAKKKRNKDAIEMEKAGLNDIDEGIFEELSNGKPVAYITGKKKFCGLEFQVDENTLIPRTRTEILTQTVLELYETHFKPRDRHNLRVLDIGTGSGCILLSCLKAIPGAYGIGIDISSSALDIANRNATSLGLEERCHFSLGDLNNPQLQITEGAFDIVVCNPPYLAAYRMNSTHFQCLQYEPREALFSTMVKTGINKIPSSYLSLSKLDQDFLFNPDSIFPCLVLEIGKSIDARSLRDLFDPVWQFNITRKDDYQFDRCWVWQPKENVKKIKAKKSY